MSKKGFIKQRFGKNSSRGVYIQDKELLETAFLPGTTYRYIVSVKSHQLFVLPTSNEGSNSKINTVSKRKIKNLTKSVLDMRSNSALSAFKGCDYLQITIYQDQVIVEGFADAKESYIGSLKRKARRISKRILGIQDLISVRKQAEITMSLSDLEKQVVGLGSYSQVSIDDWLDQKKSSIAPSAQKALKAADIPLKVVSLFSGAGIMDKAFLDEGYEIVAAIEREKYACETYALNISKNIHCGDIKNFKGTDMPKASVCIGGSPCQGFSNSNRITHFLDNPKNLLVREYIRMVKELDVDVFVLENVPQILTAGGGKFKAEILEALSDFDINYGIMTAAKYGDALLRNRAIFIGSKIGSIPIPESTVDAANYKTVRQALAGLNDSVPNQMEYTQARDITLERIKCVPPGGNIFDIPIELRPGGNHSNHYKRLEWDKPSISIVHPRKAIILHPEEHRRLSVRECARLFGLPDDFVFTGNSSQNQQSIANAVPISISKAIARAVKEKIAEYNLANQLVRI